MAGIITYTANNSGGSWWLDDKDWFALEEAGWTVHWQHDRDDPSHVHDGDEAWMLENKWGMTDHSHSHAKQNLLTKVVGSGERWLGCLAKSAAKATDNPAEAVAEWERITGQCASDEGCNCCGSPHSFEFTDADGNTQYTSVEVTATRLNWS